MDEQGNVKEYYDYYPFGKTLRAGITGPEVTTYKFTGKELDDENDLNWYYFGARRYDPEIGRFLSVDRFADKYPSLSPYHYAANNPLRFIDVNGDTIYVGEAMANSEALQKYANTKEGYKYLSQFAYEGQTIIINGQEFTFANAGDYGNQNLKFMGYMDEYEGLTVPVTSNRWS